MDTCSCRSIWATNWTEFRRIGVPLGLREFSLMKWLFVTKLRFDENKLASSPLPLKPGLG